MLNPVPEGAAEPSASLDLFDLAPSAMVVCQRQGLVQKCNRAFARLVGWPDGKSPPSRQFKDLLTRPSQYIFGSQVVPPLHLLGAVEEIELDIISADGSSLPVLLGGVQMDAGNGETLHCFSLTLIKGRRAYAREQLAARAQLDRKQEYLDMAEKLARVGHWQAELATGEVFWSPEIYAIHGLDPHTTAAPSMDQTMGFFHEEDRDEVRAIIIDAINMRQPFSFQKRLAPSPSRGVRIVEAYGLCEYDSADQPTTIFGAMRDVTEAQQALKDLEASEERYRKLADSVPGLIGYWDNNLRCRFANKAYQEWTPYTPDTLMGVRMEELNGAELFAQNKPHIDAALAGERQSFERALVIASGETRDAWIQYLPDIGPDGTVRGFYSMITDVTALKERDKAEEASNALKSAILSSTQYMVIAIDPTGIITEFNAAAEAALGYSAEEIVGKARPSTFHIHEEVVARSQQLTEELGLDIKPSVATFVIKADWFGTDTHEWTFVRKDGSRFPARVTMTPLRSEGKAATGYFGVVEDMTERKRSQAALRTSEEMFRVALDHASIGMTVLDPSGRWLRVNRALADLLGYGQDELLKLNFPSVTHPDDRAASEKMVDQLLSGEIDTYTFEKRYLRKNGETVWAQLSASAVRHPDGTPQYLVAQIQDITERREVERVKNELISTVSHELRTPVTSIRGALGLLAGTMADDLPPTVNKLIDIANKNSERLILLVNDMLDIDKIAAGSMQFDLRHEWVGPMVLSAIEANQPYAARFGVTIVTNAHDVAVQVNVDAARLQQVMSNLLSNAAKFSPTDGQVDVTIEVVQRTCRISVTDQGQGISAAFAPLIFGKFTQADSSATRTKYGSGLGLHISREIIQQMGGSIGFDSTPEQGATFWVELPVLSAQDEMTAVQ